MGSVIASVLARRASSCKHLQIMSLLYLVLLLDLPGFIYAFNFGGSEAPLNVEEKYDRRKMTTHTFKSPFYLVRGAISFWSYGGSAVVTDDYVRLTPAERSRTGYIWNTKAVAFNNWEVELGFKIGSTSNMGADGMAFWYVSQPKKEGTVFGSKDNWNGLGVIFDTFDNDGQGDNPYITVIVNDGSYSFSDDGKARQLGGCRSFYRNYESKAKITYADGIIQVMIKNGLDTNSEYTLCAQAATSLPNGYYFGVTAATGAVSDNHDLYSFETYRLVPKNSIEANEPQASQPPQQQQQPPQQQQQQQQGQQQQQQPPSEPWNEGQRGEGRYENALGRLNRIRADLYKNQNQGQQQQENVNPPPVQQDSQQQYQAAQADAQYQQQPPPPPQQQQTWQQAQPQQQQQQQGQQQQQPPSYTAPAFQQQQWQQVPPAQQPQAANIPRISAENVPQVLEALTAAINNIQERQLNLLNTLNAVQTNLNKATQSIEGQSNVVKQLQSQQQTLAESLNRVSNAVSNNKGGDNSGMVAEIQSISNQLGQVRQTVDTKVSSSSDQIMRQFDAITRILNDIRTKVDATKNQQQNIEQNLRRNTEQISSTIENNTSFSFWIFFILFQIIFGVAFMWWKKYRDESNKKLI